MKETQDSKPVQQAGKVKSYQGSEKEQQLRVERLAFIACLITVIGLPTSLIGIGLILGVIGLVLGIRAQRPNRKKPVGAIVAMIIGIIDIVFGIPGCIVIYGTVINPDSEFVRGLVQAIFGIQG